MLGKALPTSHFTKERLSNPEGLAVLASDALSSTAYATEETLLILVAAGSGALSLSLPIAAAISIAAGTAALTSAFPNLQPFTVSLCVCFIFLLMLANLRGVRESGRLFMIPTYAFIASIFILIGLGLFQQVTGQIPQNPHTVAAKEPLACF